MMKKMNGMVFALALMLIAPLTLVAQPPFGSSEGFFATDGSEFGSFKRGKRGSHGMRGLLPPPGLLDLSDEQIEDVREIADLIRTELEPLREDGKVLREQLHESLESDSPDPTEVGQLMIDIQNLRGQSRSVLESYEGQFSAILTPEQLETWENFREFRETRRERRQARRGTVAP